LAYVLLKTFKLFDFPIIWLLAYPMDILTETHRIVRTTIDIYIFYFYKARQYDYHDNSFESQQHPMDVISLKNKTFKSITK
jgi:hypothetical protein